MLTTALSPTATREEAANVIDAANCQLDDILAWGSKWQVTFGAEMTQAIPITCLREDARLLIGQLRFDEHVLPIQDSINIRRVEVDSKLCFDRHLESVARKAVAVPLSAARFLFNRSQENVRAQP